MSRLHEYEGILIEGVDYAGKTTVARSICERLERAGISTRRRACFVNDQPLIDTLMKFAKASDSMQTRDWYYTTCILLDMSLPPTARERGLLVQERHCLSQIARNLFFYGEHGAIDYTKLMQQLRPRFTYQIYLTSDMATKIERVRSRPANSPRDALLAGDPRLHQRFDEFARALLPWDEEWRIIDTSGRSVESIVDECLCEVTVVSGQKSTEGVGHVCI